MICREGRAGARIRLAKAVGLVLWGWLSLGGVTGGLEISSDEEFLRVPGITGAGTEEDPFVITGVFDAQGGPFALKTRNTRVHFVIEGATFRGVSAAGLWLENVENGWVVGCVFEGNEVGVKVGGDRVGVTFTLNTFRANRRHAAGRAQGVRWHDGHAGNFWEGYAGTDEDGDGIGNVPHWVIPVKGAWDLFPLVAPLVGIEPPEGTILLQFRANVDDRLMAEADMSMALAAKFLEEELRTEMEGRIVAEGVVGAFLVGEATANSASRSSRKSGRKPLLRKGSQPPAWPDVYGCTVSEPGKKENELHTRFFTRGGRPDGCAGATSGYTKGHSVPRRSGYPEAQPITGKFISSKRSRNGMVGPWPSSRSPVRWKSRASLRKTPSSDAWSCT